MLRRTMLWLAGLTMARPILANAAGNSGTALQAFSDVEPRHVLCFLGKEKRLDALKQAALSAIQAFAPDFEVDEDYSQDEADDRMPRSFSVCWDRVYPDAWEEADEQAVENHGSVLYVLGPSMGRTNSVEISATALRLIAHMLDHGAIAAKGESAGVAHGIARWKTLAAETTTAGDRNLRAGICRLALAKRPLGTDMFLTSVGFHLVGLPEVYIAKELGGERELAAAMDRIADEMQQLGVDAVVKKYGAVLEPTDGYDDDDFKFNPYGALQVKRL